MSEDVGCTQSDARRRPNSARRFRIGAGLVALTSLIAVSGSIASAAATAPVFSVGTTTLKVSGTTATVDTTFYAKPSAATSSYSICIRDANKTNYDFPHFLNQTISSTGTAFHRTRTLSAGTYWYYACVLYNKVWTIVGPTTKVQVGTTGSVSSTSGPTAGSTPTTTPAPATTTPAPATTTPAPATTTPAPATTTAPPKPSATATPQPPVAAAAAASTAMPVGDLPGWKQVFTDDFTSPMALGSYSTSGYPARWFAYSGYKDTSGHGTYNPAKVMSVSNGALDWYVHSENGTRYVAAMVPRVPATRWGQTYGRYSFRFRADTMPGYKMVGILWPDSDNWGEGEIDFPEVNELVSTEKVYANLYAKGDLVTKKPGPGNRFTASVAANDSGWHIATIEWGPGSATYYLDGTKLGTFTQGVPNTSFHLVFQVETVLYSAAPAESVSGHVQLDWVTMYSRS